MIGCIWKKGLLLSLFVYLSGLFTHSVPRKKKNWRQLIESTSGAACTRVDWLTGMHGHIDKDTWGVGWGAWAVLPVCWGLTARCGRGESAISYWWWMLLVVMVVGWGGVGCRGRAGAKCRSELCSEDTAQGSLKNSRISPVRQPAFNG